MLTTLSVAPREDLVGEALKILYEQHGYKREDFFLQTKLVCSYPVFNFRLDVTDMLLGLPPLTGKTHLSSSLTTLKLP